MSPAFNLLLYRCTLHDIVSVLGYYHKRSMSILPPHFRVTAVGVQVYMHTRLGSRCLDLSVVAYAATNTCFFTFP